MGLSIQTSYNIVSMKRLLILERGDLPRDFKELDIHNISPRNFSYGPYNMIKESDMVLFNESH